MCAPPSMLAQKVSRLWSSVLSVGGKPATNLCQEWSVSHSTVSDSQRTHELYSQPVSSVHGILQTRILEWVAISFPRLSSQPRDRSLVFSIAGIFFTIWVTRESTYLGELIFQACSSWHKQLGLKGDVSYKELPCSDCSMLRADSPLPQPLGLF